MDTSKIVEKIQYGNVVLTMAGSAGVEDYEKLYNKPSINGIELIGNKNTADLGLISVETDPTVPEYVKAISAQNIYEWDNKADESELLKVESIAKGANQALSYSNYETMIAELNTLTGDEYNIGQNIMIVTLNVPDLWISGVSESSVEYAYVTDEVFIGELNSAGIVQIGKYIVSALETQKVDLTDYVKNTDYASKDKGGVMRINGSYGISSYHDGFFGITTSDEPAINTRSRYRALTLGTLDYAIKVGLTTNTETLTAEEKASAQRWLGVPLLSAAKLDDGSYSLSITTEV